MAKDLLKISVQTLPNGYSLSVNKEEYMYFNVIELVAGFLAHVGLCDTKEMERGDIITMLFQTMVGKAWGETVDNMTLKMTSLEKRTGEAMTRLNTVINSGERIQPTIDDIKSQLQDINDSIKEQRKKNHAASKDSTEAKNIANDTFEKAKNEASDMKDIIEYSKKAAADIAKMRKDAEEYLRRAENILKKNKDAVEANDLSLIEVADDAPADTEEKPFREQPAGTGRKAGKKEPKTKARGGRKKNDEAVLRAIEAQAKTNPNIK